MSSAAELAQRNLFEVFGERDPAARTHAAEEIHASDVEFHDPEGTVTGPATLAATAGALLDASPGFVFTLRRVRDDGGTLGILDWGFGPEGGSPVVTGTDVVLVANDRIRSLYTVLDT